jgi:hypothetical protein
MSFAKDGFFSGEIEHFRLAVRGSSKFKPWFNYALELNRVGLDLVRHASISQADESLTVMHSHFVRTQHAFQGALLMCERGMVRNAKILLQSGLAEVTAMSALIHAGADNRTTINSIVQLLTDPTKQRSDALKGAPDTDGLVETVCAACLLLHWVAGRFAAEVGRIEVARELAQQTKAFDELSGALRIKSAAA